MAAKKAWLNLEHPASFSSATYLAKELNKKEKNVKNELKQSILFQSHRDLREKFKRRSDFATFEGQRWEMDTANFGKKLNSNVSQEIKTPLMLVCVDVFSKKIYGEYLQSKKGEDVIKALKNIFKISKKPKNIESDRGGEFFNKKVELFLKNMKIKHSWSYQIHKSRMAERAIRSLKRIIMTAALTDKWPNKKWEEIPKIASASLRERYNRSIKNSPNLVNKKLLLKQEWDNAEFENPYTFSTEENKIQKGQPLQDGAKAFSLGDFVLAPIQKKRRAEVKDKEFLRHYELSPVQVCQIYHARKPYMYKLINPRTKRKLKRLFYGTELKKVTLPFKEKAIEDVRVKNGSVEYLSPKGWVKTF